MKTALVLRKAFLATKEQTDTQELPMTFKKRWGGGWISDIRL